MRIYANPGLTLKSQTAEFLHEKCTKVADRSKKCPCEGTKAFLKEGRKPGIFVFGQFLQSSWIRIRIPNTDPDPGHTSEYGSGSTKLV
jgi:hypothetical protein